MTRPELAFFDWDDFACKCGCGENLVNEESALRLDQARAYAGVPFIITSAYRCPEHNSTMSTSPVHPSGHAFDIAANDSRTRYLVLEGMRKAGFKRIGIAKSFVHGDDHPESAQEVLWLY